MRKLNITLIYNNKNFLEFINSSNIIRSYNNTVYSYIEEIDSNSYKSLFQEIKDTGSWFYFNTPFENKSYLAFGNLFENETEKISRHEFSADIRIPTFFGGAMFPIPRKTDLWSDFKTEEWFVPEFILMKYESKYFLTTNLNDSLLNIPDVSNRLSRRLKELTEAVERNEKHTELNSGQVDYNTWRMQIDAALDQIKSGYVDKVVLARYLVKTLKKEAEVSQIILNLEERYPDCYIYLWRRKGSLFFGASPEKFISIRESKLSIDALAGSAKRGKDKNEDEEIAEALLNDSKNLFEHNAVLSYILDRIKDYASDIKHPERPRIKKLRNIQHLWTPVTAVINKEVPAGDLTKRLFPTPAVCGLPKERALGLIKKLETFDRGLYSGILGWKDAEGNAELTVSIRSGLLRNNFVYLFAGCGIVDGSDSKEEFKETELKLKPILNLFYS
ncbi:menaquinone-specific isochorismate synthase [Melioribacter roseus P3M-2]|uniref:isochorismate synthase n=1 Tax=Melioribacter roseus (strain DSM 23840 / JCM 17771 / VKM B-2668 / P3M-2) TaxID=1191523 RepID=I7A0A1_MELRP|nr:isochorismate synthase [Melioribacter roseus]AFN74688.1 menaquinone-specific isochorismate synthase [Melioribacter roseus P3M-2]